MDQTELRALADVDCAPKLLTLRVIAWAKDAGRAGQRDGLDEALANAVAASHWGCTRQDSHAAYASRAFALLHTLFPDSDAARRTKYWFACPLLDRCPAPDPLAARSVD
jgi:hypothetical protein